LFRGDGCNAETKIPNPKHQGPNKDQTAKQPTPNEEAIGSGEGFPNPALVWSFMFLLFGPCLSFGACDLVLFLDLVL
jgi:hypothetical protein